MSWGHKDELFPKQENYSGILRITNPPATGLDIMVDYT